jgi:hypothetical protein
VTIDLPAFAAPVDELWHALLDLAEALPTGWTLVGGHMVLLHALEHGHVPPTISQDGDVVADVRTDRRRLSRLVSILERQGFSLAGMSAEGLAHRYTRPAQRKAVMMDVLAPDGLGGRADLTTSSPGRTVEVPGGTQALARTESIAVVHEGRGGQIPRPTLLAAIVLKAAATTLSDPARHHRDLALLCALVGDPFELAEEMTAKDRQRLKRVTALTRDSHQAWMLLPDEIRSRGQITFAVLSRDS